MTQFLLLALLFLPWSALSAQQTSKALASWIDLDAPVGDERLATSIVARSAPGWTIDVQGNLIKRVGNGRPRRVFACGIGHSGYVVSQITDAGYLRLHRAGSAAGLHPFWDQAHEAQQVEVRTARGVVPGVVAVPNGHFARQHRGDTAIIHVDQLWVDVGARSRAEVATMGIALIDPVRRDVPAWEYAGHVAGADASGRTGCAALVAVGSATATVRSGETVFIVSTARSFGWTGLGGALSRLRGADELTLITPAPIAFRSQDPVIRRRIAPPGAVAAPAGFDSITALSVRTRAAGTLVESVRTDDADVLRGAVADLAGAAGASWVALDVPRAARQPADDSLSALAERLRQLADLPGVPGHEFRVRDAIRAGLPAWARQRAVVDSEGNLLVSVGPSRDTVVAIAHMDEVSHVVSAIRGDGTVALDARGGVIPSAWEGQPAMLHFDPDGTGQVAPSLPGVFIPRDTGMLRAPRSVSAYFGLDSAGLVARGVRAGQGVTAFKRAQRLGATRFTGRGMDDRAGSTALLAALNALDTTRLDHTVIFAWSTAEEGGLVGARAMARRFGPTVRRVYAIDTFVSSDTPLEQPTFAWVPLGRGAVLRALDDGIQASRAERERVIGIAEGARIPLQIGTTHGSTDATPFIQWGAVGAGLSWAGRYSHSPAEVLDLRDLSALSRLIRAVVSAPTR